MTLLEWMAAVQKATRNQPEEKIERLFKHGCDNQGQCWGLADCLIAAGAMFNHDKHQGAQYLYFVYNAIHEGVYTEVEVSSNLEGRLRDLKINI